MLRITFLFSLALFGCSSQTINNSHSEKIYSDSSSTPSQHTESTNNAAKQKADLEKIYSQVIGDYIRLVNKEYKITFDTLLFGKHVVGQPDDFPDIELPAVIENTSISLISPEQGQKKQKENKSSFYINLIGWVDADKADFTFVTFSNGFAHQFDCFITYKYDTIKKDFEKESSRFENFLYKKK